MRFYVREFEQMMKEIDNIIIAIIILPRITTKTLVYLSLLTQPHTHKRMLELFGDFHSTHIT